MSDTPRTDAEILWMPDCVPADFARTLEHELAAAKADAAAERESRGMFVVRLEKMQEQGNHWLTVAAVLALLNDCDFLASRSAALAKGPK